MLYVKNNFKYAVAFTVTKDGREKIFEFDCRRVYQDTGNIVTTGVTPIAEEDYELLYKEHKRFKKYADEGKLVKTKESGATSVANKMNELERENEILRQQLAEKVKEESTGKRTVKKDNKTAEALAKVKGEEVEKTETEVDETEGF